MAHVYAAIGEPRRSCFLPQLNTEMSSAFSKVVRARDRATDKAKYKLQTRPLCKRQHLEFQSYASPPKKRLQPYPEFTDFISSNQAECLKVQQVLTKANGHRHIERNMSRMDSSDRISKEQYAPQEYSNKLSPYEESLQGPVLSGIEETSPGVYNNDNVHIGLATENWGKKHIWSVQPPDPDPGSIENPAHASEAYAGDVRNGNTNKSEKPCNSCHKSIQEVMDRLISLETKVSKLQAAEKVSRKCTNYSETFNKPKSHVFNEELDELFYTDSFEYIAVQDEHINSDCEADTICKMLVTRNDEEIDGFERLSENNHSSDYPLSTSFSAKELGVSLDEEQDLTDDGYQNDFAHMVYEGDNSCMYGEEEEQELLIQSEKTKQSEPCGGNKVDCQDQLVAQTKCVLRQYDDSHKPKIKKDTHKEELWNVVGETAQYEQKDALDEIMLTAAGLHDQLTVDNQSDKPKDHSGKSAYQLAELKKQSVCQELEDRSPKPAGQSQEPEDTSNEPAGQSQELEDRSHKPEGQSQEFEDRSDKPAGQSQELKNRSNKTPGQLQELEDRSNKTAGQSQEPKDRSDEPAGQSQELEDRSHKPAGQSQEPEDRSEKPAGQPQEPEDRSHKTPGQSQEFEDMSDKPAGQSKELEDTSHKPAGQSQEFEDRSDKPAGQPQELEDRSDKPAGQLLELEDRSNKTACQSQEPKDRSDKPAGQLLELEDRSDKPAGQLLELEDRSNKTAGQSQELEDTSNKTAGQSQLPEDTSHKPAGQSQELEDTSNKTAGQSQEPEDTSNKTAGQSQEPEDRSHKPAGQSQEPEDTSDKPAGQSQELEDRSHKPEGQSQEFEDRSDKPAGQSKELEDTSHKPAVQSQELEDMSHKPAGQSQELEDTSHKPAGQSKELEDTSHKPAGQSQELEDRSHKPAGQSQELEDMSDKPAGQSQELEDRSHKPAGQSQKLEDRSHKATGQSQEPEDMSHKPAGQSQELEYRSEKQSEKSADHSCELVNQSEEYKNESGQLNNNIQKNKLKLDEDESKCKVEPVLQIQSELKYKGQFKQDLPQQKKADTLKNNVIDMNADTTLSTKCVNTYKGLLERIWAPLKAPIVAFWSHLCCIIELLSTWLIKKKDRATDKAKYKLQTQPMCPSPSKEHLQSYLEFTDYIFSNQEECLKVQQVLPKANGLIAKAECQALLSDDCDLTSEGELEHTSKQINNALVKDYARKTVEKADNFIEHKNTEKLISVMFGHTQTFQDSDVATITNKDMACSDAKINQETSNKTGDATEEPCNVIKGTVHPTRKRERMLHLKDESTKLNAKDLFEGKQKRGKRMSTTRNALIAKQVKSFFNNRADSSLEHQQTDCMNRKDRSPQSLMNRKRFFHKKAPQYKRNTRQRKKGNAREPPSLPRVPHPEMDNDAPVPTQTPEDSGYLSIILTSMSSLSSRIQSVASSSAEPCQSLLKESLKAQEYDIHKKILHIISNWDYFRPAAVSLHVAPGLEDYFTSIENGENVSTEVEMSIEMLRIRSLSEYRGDGSRVNLAKNGFFFEPSQGPSGTRCAGCKCVYQDWKFFDDIPAIHRRLSPNCPYVTGLPQGNNDDVEPRSSNEASSTATAAIATRLADAQRTADVIPSRTAEVATNQSSNFITSTSQGQNIAVTSMTGENSNSDLSPLAASSSEAVAVPKNCSALDELTSSLQQANLQAAEKTDQGGAATQPSEDAENDSLLRTTNLYGQQGLNVRNPLRVGRQNQSGPRRAPEEPSQPNNCPAILTEQGLSDLAAKIGEEWIMFFLCLQMPIETIQEIIERHGDQASVNTIKACLKRWKDSNSDTDEKKVDLISNSLNEIGRAELVAYLRQYNQDPQQSLGPNFIGAGPSASRTTVNVYEGTNEPRQVDIVNPRYPQYASVDVRISSFKGWPLALGLTARQMAEAGFFYAGVADFTRCFACGGGLRNWESGDDPCLEHTRWFPHCEYMKKLKGEVYVRNIKLRQQQHLERQKKEQEEEEARKNAAKKDLTTPVETDAGKILQGMGYTAERITSVIETLRKQTGKVEVSAEQALRYILDEDEGNTPVTVATPGRPPQASNQTGATGSLSSATAAKAAESLSIATAKSSDSQASSSGESASVQSKPHSRTQTSSPSLSSSSRSPVRNEMQGSANGKSGKKKKKKKGKNEDKNTNEATNLDPASLLEENERLKEMQKCKICMDNAVDTTLLPCGHLVLCSDCAIKVNLCPICRLKIMGTVRTFLS